MLKDQSINKLYPQPKGKVYANTSSFGLMSSSGIRKCHEFHVQLFEQGSDRAERFLSSDFPDIRKKIADFIDAGDEEVAVIPNFSFGLNTVLPAIAKRRRVLLFEKDYPSLTQPFLLQGFEISWIKSHDHFSMDIDEIKDRILAEQIDIVAISHVQYLTGFLIDVASLGSFCKKHDVIFILDGTQSLGAFPLSFKKSKADVFISSNYKWMNAGFGTGIMAISKDFMRNYPPKIGGFHSFVLKDAKWIYEPSIHSYEPGHQNMAGMIMLEDAIGVKLNVGVAQIYKHNVDLIDQLINQIKHSDVSIVGPESNRNRCGIIGIRREANLADHLMRRGIIFKMRNDIIRIGIHFYNTASDVSYIAEALKSYGKN